MSKYHIVTSQIEFPKPEPRSAGLLLLLLLALGFRITLLGLILRPGLILVITAVLLIRLGELRRLPRRPLALPAAALVRLLLNL